MATTPENKVKAKLIQMLKEKGVFNYPNSAGPFSAKGISDRTAIYKGIYIALEVKAPGKKATPLQLKFMADVNAVGGKSFLIDGEEAIERLKLWLECVYNVHEG